MLNIYHLVYPLMLTNSEFVTFLKTSTDYVTAFIEANNNSGDDDDRPVIEMLKSDLSNLTLLNNDLLDKFSVFRKVMEIPRKHIDSDEIILINSNRIKIVGDAKKVVKLAYDNTKSKGSGIVWNIIRDYKNFRLKPMDKITGEITNMLEALDTEENIAYCTEIKVSSLIAKLKEENEKFETLYNGRDVYDERNKKKSIIPKKECIQSFYTMIEYINSTIIANRTDDYDDLVISLNSVIEPNNTYVRNKKKSKKEEDDRPVIEFEKKKKRKVKVEPENTEA